MRWSSDEREWLDLVEVEQERAMAAQMRQAAYDAALASTDRIALTSVREFLR